MEKSEFAVVTGAAGLLGFEHAFAILELGYNLILVDIDESGLAKCKASLLASHPAAVIETLPLDIQEEEQIKSHFALRRNISCLINNAALNPPPGIEGKNFELDSWNKEIAVGLTGAMLMCKYIGNNMSNEGRGSIINIASDLSIIAPDQRIYHHITFPTGKQYEKPISYSVVKSGLIGLTKYLATYWADTGVRVNALSPGSVLQHQDPQLIKEISNRVPLGRLAKASEYREAIKFLATDSSSYMTGHNLIIDGGRSIW